MLLVSGNPALSLGFAWHMISVMTMSVKAEDIKINYNTHIIMIKVRHLEERIQLWSYLERDGSTRLFLPKMHYSSAPMTVSVYGVCDNDSVRLLKFQLQNLYSFLYKYINN